MRVGIIAFQHESNTFAAGQTSLADFERDHILTGEDVRDFMRDAHHEVGGFLQGLEESGIEAVPIFFARALPGGPIKAGALQHLLSQMFSSLSTQHSALGPARLDGLLVAPHGAAVSVDRPDVDGYWLSLLRESVGPDVPIVCTIDPHANLSAAMVRACDATIAYRTNPHVDQRERGREAAGLMAAALRGEIELRQAASFPPMVINIERQRTAEPHCRALYEQADVMGKQPGVLSVSVVLGFPYADVEEMGSSVIVVTDGRRADPQPLADELGQYLWTQRREFAGKLIDVEDALNAALSTQQSALSSEATGPVLLLDMGDNVGGGAPGDGTIIAHALHRRAIGLSLMTLCDPESVAACEAAGIGSRIRLRMGGKTDARQGPPFEADVEVVKLFDGRFREQQVRHGGWADFDMGRTAVVRSDGGLTLMLTSQRLFPVSTAQLTAFGIDPRAYRVIVAKGVHAPVAAYESICSRIIRVNTPGVTTANMESLEYRRRHRPLFPFERDFGSAAGKPAG